MPKLYFHIPPIPYFLPRFIINLGVGILLRYRKKRYGYEFRLIKLTGGKPVGATPAEARYARVDPEDYDKLNCYDWQCIESSNTFYAVRIVLEKAHLRTIRMHREIMQAPKERVVDHHDHNGLNNRKSNLTIATAAENRRHSRKTKGRTSKYKGVHLDKRTGRWQATICCNYKHTFLGRFDDEIEAAKVYDEAAKKYHKEFAVLNFEETSHEGTKTPRKAI